MTITSIGYDGSVNEAQWATLIPRAGSAQYGVAGAFDWKVTAHATLDRGVTIATGTGWGWGVMDTSDATVSLQGATVGSGSRWDLVVARRNWSGTGGVTSFVIISGSAAKSLPARNTSPGSLDDQPVALVQFTAGSTAPTGIVDLRCWGVNGGMTARDDLALTYLKAPGASIMVNGTHWNCELDVNGNQTWTTFVAGRIPLLGAGGTLAGGASPAGAQFQVQAGSLAGYTDGAGYGRVTFPNPFTGGLLSIVATSGDDWAIGSGGVTFAGSGNPAHGSSATGSVNDWVYVMHGYAGGNNDGPVIRKTNQLHRLNWIAVGW